MILRGVVYSKTLAMDTQLSVVVPNQFRQNQPYKVVYLLHGLGSDHHGWLDRTLLPMYAEEYDAVIVMPNVGRSFYTDMAYGPAYYSYVTKELPQICKAVFRISGQPEDTAIMGGSMGGYGALKCAFSQPDAYQFCAALAPGGLYLADYLDSIRGKRDPYSKLQQTLVSVLGDDLVFTKEHDVLALAKEAAKANIKPEIYLSCGLEDEFLSECRKFDSLLKSLGMDVRYEELPGGHDWYYFDKAIGRALHTWLGRDE